MRREGIGNLLQAAVFGAAISWVDGRWLPATALMGICLGAHVLGGGALLTTGRQRIARWSSALSLLLVAVMIGLYTQGAMHIIDRFGPDAQNIGRNAIWSGVAALPWLVAFPLWQVLGSPMPHRNIGGAALILIGIPHLVGQFVDQPQEQWHPQPNLVEAADASWKIWNGMPAALPSGDAAVVLLTPWINGEATSSVRGEGPTLAEAIQDALGALPPPSGRAALVLDVALERFPHGGIVPAGDGGGLSAASGRSPSALWRPGNLRSRSEMPQWRIKQPDLKEHAPARFESAVADADGAVEMHHAWSAPPALTADHILSAALEGGRFLARHQDENGKFAYTIKGPSGQLAGGYNFPRHAGTAWFMARLANRTQDPEIQTSADKAIAFIVAHTTHLDDGRAYFQDARRSDGMAWVGTTSLAALALVEQKHPLAVEFGQFLASSIDERGQVLGEMNRESSTFDPQQQNPYGQGQTLLALAALVNAGHDDLRPAMARTAAFVDGDYSPNAAGRLVVLDEHWACLAALELQNAEETPSGKSLCMAYLDDATPNTPETGNVLQPSAGAAGGLAEAVIAGALLDPDGPWRDQAMAYGELFLKNSYQSKDAAFLPLPDRLMGGMRDTPVRLDVRMDAVQHIGCALLGIEDLLRAG